MGSTYVPIVNANDQCSRIHVLIHTTGLVLNGNQADNTYIHITVVNITNNNSTLHSVILRK